MRRRIIVPVPKPPLLALPRSAATGLEWQNQTAIGNPAMYAPVFNEVRTRRQQPIPLRAFPHTTIVAPPVSVAASMAWVNPATLARPMRIIPRRQQPFPHTNRAFPLRAITGTPAPPQSTLNPTRFAIILSDKNGNTKARLEHIATTVKYSWLSQGGCGPFSMVIPGDYIRFTINPDDDIQIWLPEIGGGATLVYRGIVESTTPQLNSGSDGQINIEGNGYFGVLDRIMVQDSNEPLVFESVEVSQIVDQLLTDFILPNSPITLGTIDASAFTPDTIAFKTSVKAALQTLFELAGQVEYGIDANRQFFWRNRSQTVAHKFFLGDKIVKLSDRIDFKQIYNKLYLEGGDDNGTVFILTATSQSSIDRYRLRERFIQNGSITTASVGNKFLSSLLKQQAGPKRQLSIQLINTKKRLEALLPIGAVSVIDPDRTQIGALYGTTGNGGSNKLYGLIADGGSGQLYGGSPRNQVNRINYSINPSDGRYDAEVLFESTENVSPSSATLKQIQQNLDAVRQRQF